MYLPLPAGIINLPPPYHDPTCVVFFNSSAHHCLNLRACSNNNNSVTHALVQPARVLSSIMRKTQLYQSILPHGNVFQSSACAVQCGVRVVQGIEEFTSTHGAVCTPLRNAAYFPVRPVLCENGQVQGPGTCYNLRAWQSAVFCKHSTVDQGDRFHVVMSAMTVALHSLCCRVYHCSRRPYNNSTRACCIL